MGSRDLGLCISTKTYTYGDSQWGDLLTAFNGNPITYDAVGNPLSDGTWTYTWEHGRQLASMTGNGATWNYTYNSATGMRTGRSNGSTAYSYVYNGSQLVYMTVDGNTLYIVYDALGVPSILTYNGTTYFYITNIQGDVVAIADRNHNMVVMYEYDAWGNILSTTGSMASTLGVHNPLRYRGYVYDTETGLYYLQSRYYNPYIGRFINADAYASTGQGFIGNNMFAYCLNNPVNSADSEGTVADNYFGWVGEQIGIFLYEWITGDDHPQKQVQLLEDQIIEKQTEVVANGVKALGDAYMRSYNLQLEAQLQNSIALIEGVEIMWNNPKETVDMAIAIGGVADTTYKLAMVFVAGHPASGIVISVATAVWGLYRTIEGFISASSS